MNLRAIKSVSQVRIIFYLCLIVLATGVVSGMTLTHQYRFSEPDIRPVTLDRQEYYRIKMPEASPGGPSGAPALPVFGARLLIPSGEEVSSIKATATREITLDKQYRIVPIQMPSILSRSADEIAPTPPDDKIYISSRLYPKKLIETVGQYSFRGYTILVLRLYPVQYIPSEGTVTYYPELEITVETVPSGKTSSLFRDDPGDRHEVISRVDNPEIIGSYPPDTPATRDKSDNFQLMILTTRNLSFFFLPLEDFYDNAGITTEIFTLEDIGGYGLDNIRGFITEKYLQNHIEYLLIGGDDDIIPAYDMFAIAPDCPYGDVPDNTIPSDLFYACLDGPYNADGDEYAGEPDDGADFGDIDLMAEVYVARAPVGTPDEVARFINKTISYTTRPGAYRDRILMAGEHLGFGEDMEYAGISLDELVDSSDAHGYFTYGIPADSFSLDRLYDLDWPTHNWPTGEIINRINNGLNVISHLGHGYIYHCLKLDGGSGTPDMLDNLTNDDLFFVYSQACMAGQLDGYDCWAEQITIKRDQGAAATICNARYGLGAYYITDSPSQRFNREFWDALYNPGENIRHLARALQDSREDNLYRINDPGMRWVCYEQNLFGSPVLTIDREPYKTAFIRADTVFGTVPLAVQFNAESYFDLGECAWSFGDGDSAFTASPEHIYTESGHYDIGLRTTIDETVRDIVRHKYIAVVADSVYPGTVSGTPGVSLALTVYARNTVPVQYITIPAEYSGPLELTYDSCSTAGCRSENCMIATPIYYNPVAERLAFRLEGYLAGGHGPVMKVFFTIDSGAVGNANIINLAGFTGYQPLFNGYVADYKPATGDGDIELEFICGDVTGDEKIDILDIIALITYKYGTYPVRLDTRAADLNGDSVINIVDIIQLVTYKMKNGPAPGCGCQ